MRFEKSPRGWIKSIGEPLFENENHIYIRILCIGLNFYFIKGKKKISFY